MKINSQQNSDARIGDTEACIEKLDNEASANTGNHESILAAVNPRRFMANGVVFHI